MAQEKNYFNITQRFSNPRKISIYEANDLLEIFEDSYDSCRCLMDEYYRQIALLHLVIGIPNKDKTYSRENAKINQWIYNWHNKIEEYKEKYEHKA